METVVYFIITYNYGLVANNVKGWPIILGGANFLW